LSPRRIGLLFADDVPDKEPQSSLTPRWRARRRGRPLRRTERPPRRAPEDRPPRFHRGELAWILFIAVYAVIFALSGSPISRAIRGAFANDPDGFSPRVFRRREGWTRPGRGEWLLLANSPRVVWWARVATKTLLLWIDVW